MRWVALLAALLAALSGCAARPCGVKPPGRALAQVGGLDSDAARRVLTEAEIMSYYATFADQLTNCTKAAICDPRFEEQANSTVAIVVHRKTNDPENGNLALGSCTGTLLTSPDRKKTYILTATHCYSNRTDLAQFSNYIAVFNWNPDSCTVPPAVPTFQNVTQAVRGMRLVFYDPGSDVLLLELTTNIPSSWGARAAGIQISNVAPLDVVSIHHGAGSWKKISYANTSLLEQGAAVGLVPEAVILGSKQNLVARPKDHWRVTWTDGVTQGGSSGSGLFDAETGKVVAVLSGGQSSCGSDDKTDYYGRLASAWGRGLANYLGEGAGAVPPEGDLIYSSEAHEDVSAEGGVGTDISAFMLDPSNPEQVIAVMLVDPPEDADAIIVDIELTSLLGAGADAYVVTPTRLVFTDDDPQNITVSFANGAAAAGEDSVFVLTLTAKNESGQPLPARDSARVKGVAAATATPEDLAETLIPELPYNGTAPIDNADGKAVFAYNATEDGSVDVKLCTVPGLKQDTALVVVQGEEIYAVVADGGTAGDDCVAMTDVQLTAGQQYYFLLSDADLLEFVVPMSLVSSFEVTPVPSEAAAAQ